MKKEFYPWGFLTVLLFQFNAAVLFLCALNCFIYVSTSVGPTWVWAVVTGLLSTAAFLLMTLERLFKFKRNYNLLCTCLLLGSVVGAYVTYGLTNVELPYWYIYPIIYLCGLSIANSIFLIGSLFAYLFDRTKRTKHNSSVLMASQLTSR